MDAPEHLVCPCTHAPFEDPVLACDGFFYEHTVIDTAAPLGRVVAVSKPDLTQALIEAAEQGCLEDIQRLVAHGADVHAENDAALSGASRYGHVSVVQFLKSLP